MKNVKNKNGFKNQKSILKEQADVAKEVQKKIKLMD